MQQPNNCERCGDRLSPNGIMCYQKHCSYKKYTTEEGDSDDAETNWDDSGDISNDNSFSVRKNSNKDQLEKTEEEQENDNNDNDSSDNSDGSDKGGCLDLDGLGDGCIGGFLKFIWKVISFPFRVILWIGRLFDD